MPDYRLRWEIDIAADSPRKAAEDALEIMRDDEAMLPFFEVFDQAGQNIGEVDLET